jgi:stage IV sporulation protein FB
VAAAEIDRSASSVGTMNGGLDFVLLGIPVRVMWMFFFIMFLFGSVWQQPILIALWVGIAFVSILAHEFGHALVYRGFGVQPSVVIHGFGGLTFGRSLPVAKDLVVSLAGPLVGLAIGLPLVYIDQNVRITQPLLEDAILMGIYINVFWSLINLLPLMPLDGGNALNAFLSLVLRRDMTRATRVLSVLTAAVMVGFAIKYGFIFGALLAGYYGFMNIQALMQGPSIGRFSPKVTMPPKQSAPPPPPPPPGPPQGRDQDGATGPGAGSTAGPRDGQDWSPTMPTQPPVADTPDANAAAPWLQPQIGNRRRTFGQEVEATAQALARNEPELASIAVDRAARLAVSPEDAIVVQQLRDEVMRRLTAG